MKESPISPGVVIVVLALLWGLAGGVAGPELDDEHRVPKRVEPVSQAWLPHSLLCETDRQHPPAPQAPASDADPLTDAVQHMRVPATSGQRSGCAAPSPKTEEQPK